MLEETEVTCPYCWETIPLLLDLSAGSQTYTEDCSVCCRPIIVRLRVGAPGESDSGAELGGDDFDRQFDAAESNGFRVEVATEDG